MAGRCPRFARRRLTASAELRLTTPLSLGDGEPLSHKIRATTLGRTSRAAHSRGQVDSLLSASRVIDAINDRFGTIAGTLLALIKGSDDPARWVMPFAGVLPVLFCYGHGPLRTMVVVWRRGLDSSRNLGRITQVDADDVRFAP